MIHGPKTSQPRKSDSPDLFAEAERVLKIPAIIALIAIVGWMSLNILRAVQ